MAMRASKAHTSDSETRPCLLAAAAALLRRGASTQNIASARVHDCSLIQVHGAAQEYRDAMLKRSEHSQEQTAVRVAFRDGL